jgi:hypothetical protein
MGNEYDQIYTHDVLAELSRQHGQALARQRGPDFTFEGRPIVETQKVVGALIAIEIVLVLCSLGVVTWIMTSNVSLS